MSLKIRSLIFILLLMTSIPIISSLSISWILIERATSLEEQELRDEVNLVRTIITAEQQELERTVSDWANSEELSGYIDDPGKEEFESRFNSERLEMLHLSGAILYDSEQRHISSSGTDNFVHLKSAAAIKQLAGKEQSATEGRSGIVNTGSASQLFALKPITDNTKALGYLALIRNIEPELKQKISGLIKAELTMTAVPEMQVGPDPGSDALNVSFTRSENSITALSHLNDSEGVKALEISLTRERSYYRQAQEIIPLIISIMASISILAGIIIYLYLQHELLHNLNLLLAFIQKLMKQGPQASGQVPKVDGEFLQVAETLASMSVSIGSKEVELAKQNELLLQANKDLNSKSAELAKSNKELKELNNAMVGRELKMIELKKELAELKGEKIPDQSLDSQG